MSTSIRDCQNIATATSRSPVTSGMRAPMRSVSRPMIGPSGDDEQGRRERADARLERAVAEDVLHVERHEEERREHRERHGERDERRAQERGRAEEREVDHRRADPALDDREADEAEDGEQRAAR